MFLRGDPVVYRRSQRVCIVARDQNHHEWVYVFSQGEEDDRNDTVPLAAQDLIRVDSEEEGEKLIAAFRTPPRLLTGVANSEK